MNIRNMKMLASVWFCRILSPVVAIALLLSLIDVEFSSAASTEASKTAAHSEFHTTQGPVQLTTRVDRNSAQVAEAIQLTLIAEVPDGVRVSFPARTEQLGSFDIRKVEDQLDIPVAQGRKSTRTYFLESLSPGEQEVPAVGVSYLDTREASNTRKLAMSDPVRISIGSLLEGQTDPTQFRDIKGIVEISPPAQEHHYVLLSIVAASVLAGAGFAATYYLRRDRDLSASHWALAELDRLSLQHSAAELSPTEFYTQVTDIVRNFIERRFDVAAPRLTSAEFFQLVEQNHQLSPYLRPLRSFLETADMVKFAGLVPQGNDCDAAIAKARNFVEASSATSLKESA
ncbi:hypothetical protein [Adhaeretor mobilis]|uniref:Uncharacterized protein n=1 Tax=Adhaeretor mobilis TaxID=1930276 RepID=A0A517MPU1_9BACT|nr:hypothetical protein [Adhaeretor mobilis]QDS96903.1 hypothetical protein HG15A2_01620 [Adhaeretor mobilis]